MANPWELYKQKQQTQAIAYGSGNNPWTRYKAKNKITESSFSMPVTASVPVSRTSSGSSFSVGGGVPDAPKNTTFVGRDALIAPQTSPQSTSTKPLTGFAAGVQANNEGYRQLAMKNAARDDGKTFWDRIGLTSTKDGDIVTPTTLETKTRGGAPASAPTNDSDIDAYLRQMQETTARAVEDKREGVDEVDYGKLLVGTAHKGINQFASGLTSTADWLIGQPLQAVGWKNNPVTLLNQEMKNEAALLSSKYDENAAKSIPAQLTNKYGPSVVAALPQAALAYFTAGASLAAQGSTKGLQLASSAAQNSGLISTIANAARTMMSDVQFWLPVAQTAGTSYERARADGADDFKASVYATVIGLVNGLIERGGGGIQELPTQLRSGNPSLIRAWVFSSLDEGKEEVVQGVVDRILQKLIYGKNNPLFSTTDENAIFNPRTMAEDAAGGIAVGTILGGGQAVVNNAVQNWNARQGGGNGNTSTISAADANRLLYAEALMRKAQKEGNIYAERILKAQIEKAMQNSRAAVTDASAPMPTIYSDRIKAREHNILDDYEAETESDESFEDPNVDLENDANSDTIKMDRKQPTHRKIGESGRKIIDKATYHKVTAPAIRKGADIRIANDELMHYLKTRNATAVTIGDIIIFRPDATTSEVLEEIHHFYQNLTNLNAQYAGEQRQVMNELDTQEYLLSVSDKYKIPAEEIEETKLLQEFYLNEKERLVRGGKWNG